ncbi:hypothetical protein N7495_009098 [Penicillium taxi]|uniref:uncharacterized protein n=1 Tax=Penicillium taxi TaxID=168475 RepID=UPI0025458810|nr:uncharacterized protein N7495_009098 [Penicillium taxi]KAJ5889057.1 hypothetical protein N7495_009098 [Penicillium taxi]
MTAAVQSGSFEWKELSPGYWERNIDEWERFYIRSAKTESGCYPVTGFASFSVDSNIPDNERVESALRKAWVCLRHRHPSLASRVAHDETGPVKRTYSALEGADQDSWLQSTFQTYDTDKYPLAWFNDDAPDFEQASVFLVRTPHGTAVFLRGPHDITDGIGILLLLHQLFDLASKAYQEGKEFTMPVWGNEAIRLAPCLRVAAKIPEVLSEAETKWFAAVQAENRRAYSHPSLLCIPASRIPMPSTPSRTNCVSFLIPRNITKQILGLCKSISPGVSVTHVFTAALALTLAELQNKKEEEYPVRYVSHSIINLRPYCDEPYNSADNAAASCHTISAQTIQIDLVVPSVSDRKLDTGKDLRQITLDLKSFYEATRPTCSYTSRVHEQIAVAPAVIKPFTPAVGFNPHAVTSTSPFCAVPLSSIGDISTVVAAKQGPFELTRVVCLSEAIGPGLACFMGSWGGELELCAVFDSRYHDPAYIESFLRTIVDKVCTGLGIDIPSVSPI